MLNVRILGNQPEPTLVEEGMEIVDFEVRTRDEEIFAVGKDMIEQYVELNPELEGCQLYISDPMTVGLYPSHDENGNLYSGNDNPSPYNFDKLVQSLEEVGFYGKAAGYRENGTYSEAALEGLTS